MARPKTGQTPIQHMRIDQEDWDDFRALFGRRASAAVRDIVRWYIRRPGAKLPERPTVEEVAELRESRDVQA